MDAQTLRTIAKLSRSRADLRKRPDLKASRDGLQDLGAQQALEQLAVDLEAMADEVERTGRD